MEFSVWLTKLIVTWSHSLFALASACALREIIHLTRIEEIPGALNLGAGRA